MKKIMGLVLVTASACSTSLAYAEPADVLHDTGCIQFDSNGIRFLSDSDMKVYANSEEGNIKITCRSSGVFNDTGERLVYNFANTGFTCKGDTRWEQVLTPNGSAITRCHSNF